jgi:hypothetical protein
MDSHWNFGLSCPEKLARRYTLPCVSTSQYLEQRI